MNRSHLTNWIFIPLLVTGAVWYGWTMLRDKPGAMEPAMWQAMASPGRLSLAHSFLADKCASCHTANKGVEAQNCIVCHANNQSLLQRQPTAFHASISSCVECHAEHQGINVRPTRMDHAKLVMLGLHPGITPQERTLNCMTCHSNQDRHRSFFGADCIQCHTTTAWTIADFRHPAPTSTSCVQCHQAPPSHYMMHFQMISMKVAGQEHANVSQCFLCHQTTTWNDIKGVGWYKHH